MARALPKGFGSWHDYYQHRVEVNRSRGLSPAAARGHGRRGEPTAIALRRAERDPAHAPIADLRAAMLAKDRREGRIDKIAQDAMRRTGMSEGRAHAYAERHRTAQLKEKDRPTLEKLLRATPAQYRYRASAQYPGNPYWYH